MPRKQMWGIGLVIGGLVGAFLMSGIRVVSEIHDALGVVSSPNSPVVSWIAWASALVVGVGIFLLPVRRSTP